MGLAKISKTVGSAVRDVHRRRVSRRPGGFVTVGVIATVVVAMVGTFLGVGATSRALSLYDGSVWLWSNTNDTCNPPEDDNCTDLGRVNGLGDEPKIESRIRLADTKDNDIEIIQTDDVLLVHNRTTGRITSINPGTLKIKNEIGDTAGGQTRVALHKKYMLVVDTANKMVTQRDTSPTSSGSTALKVVGKALEIPADIVPGEFDSDGHYWYAVPSDGTVRSITTSSSGPKEGKKIKVAGGDHKLAVTALKEGVAVVDFTAGEVIIIKGEGKPKRIKVSGLSEALVPAKSGEAITLSIPETRTVIVIKDGKVHSFEIKGTGDRISVPAFFADRVYVTEEVDAQKSVVHACSLDGKCETVSEIPDANGALQMLQREGQLFVNAVNSRSARVIDAKGAVKNFAKLPPNVPTVDGKEDEKEEQNNGNSDQPSPNTPNPTQNPGNGTNPTPNPGGNPTPNPGGNPTGQPTGQPTGTPTVPTPTGTPTPEVGGPPNGVSAALSGTSDVAVSWGAPSSGAPSGYNVYATGPGVGSGSPVASGGSCCTSTTVGGLQPGGTYTFTVAAIYGGSQSAMSQPSNTVTIPQQQNPTTAPSAPMNVRAVAFGTTSVSVTWSPPSDTGGAPLTAYHISYLGSTYTEPGSATSHTGNSCPATSLTVAAANEAGTGPAVSVPIEDAGTNPDCTGGGGGPAPSTGGPVPGTGGPDPTTIGDHVSTAPSTGTGITGYPAIIDGTSGTAYVGFGQPYDGNKDNEQPLRNIGLLVAYVMFAGWLLRRIGRRFSQSQTP